MDWFLLSYTVLGGLGFFFFGMIMLSDALQAVGGKFIRKLINTFTTNRVVAVLVGMIVTSIIQSSSITTVMVIGFVNAGLMNLMQAIGVILGANIGTTITGWIIAIKIGKYALLLIGLAFLPMLQSKSETISHWGKIVFALGLVFLGLETMSAAFKPLRSDESFLALMTYFSADSYVSLWATIAIGCGLTFVVQSSSAMLGITIALATAGVISFQTSAALVLGENIGTTITAMLAGAAGNRHAKQAALAHSLFNLIGVTIVSTFFWKYIDVVEWMVANTADFVAEDGSKPFVATHIAASHTLFNVANVCLFLPFMGVVAKIVTFVYPDRAKEPEHLVFLGNRSTMSPTLAIAQARKELIRMGELVQEMLVWTEEYLLGASPDRKLRKRIMKRERITDAIHQEMMEFVGKLMQHAASSSEQSMQIKFTLKVSDELESLADYCQKLAHHRQRLLDEGMQFDDVTIQEIRTLYIRVTEFYADVLRSYRDDIPLNHKDVLKSKKQFNKMADAIKDAYLDRVKEAVSPAMLHLTLGDIVLTLGRIFSHTRNLAEWQIGRKVNRITD